MRTSPLHAHRISVSGRMCEMARRESMCGMPCVTMYARSHTTHTHTNTIICLSWANVQCAFVQDTSNTHICVDEVPFSADDKNFLLFMCVALPFDYCYCFACEWECHGALLLCAVLNIHRTAHNTNGNETCQHQRKLIQFVHEFDAGSAMMHLFLVECIVFLTEFWFLFYKIYREIQEFSICSA